MPRGLGVVYLLYLGGHDEDGAVSVLEDPVGHGGVHELLESGAAVGAGHNEVCVELLCHLADGIPHAGGVLHEVAFSILHPVFFSQFGAFEGEVAGVGEAVSSGELWAAREPRNGCLARLYRNGEGASVGGG